MVPTSLHNREYQRLVRISTHANSSHGRERGIMDTKTLLEAGGCLNS